MFGAGSVAAMIQSIKSNRDLTKSKRKAFDRDNTGAKWLHNKLSFKKVPSKQTQQFISKIKVQKERDNLIIKTLTILGLILLTISIYFISK